MKLIWDINTVNYTTLLKLLIQVIKGSHISLLNLKNIYHHDTSKLH